MDKDKHPFNPALSFAVGLLILMFLGFVGICIAGAIFGPEYIEGLTG